LKLGDPVGHHLQGRARTRCRRQRVDPPGRAGPAAAQRRHAHEGCVLNSCRLAGGTRFIADLCELTSWVNNPRADGYSNNGSDERRYAMEYYERVGYPWLFKPQR